MILIKHFKHLCTSYTPLDFRFQTTDKLKPFHKLLLLRIINKIFYNSFIYIYTHMYKLTYTCVYVYKSVAKNIHTYISYIYIYAYVSYNGSHAYNKIHAYKLNLKLIILKT